MRRVGLCICICMAFFCLTQNAQARQYFDLRCDSLDGALRAVTSSSIPEDASAALALQLKEAMAGCSISPQELWKLFDDNEVAAEELYKDQVVTLKGSVTDIFSNPWGTAVLSFQVEGHHKVDCEFPREARPQIAKLRKGQEVTVRGTVGHMAMKILLLKDCVLR